MTEEKRQDAKGPRRHEPSPEVDDLARRVIGAAIEVHRALHAGLPESVYESAMCLELTERGIAYERQPTVDVFYRGQNVGQGRMDLWIERRLVVELKAVDEIHKKHKAQCKAYLAATGCELALLINFHEAVLRDGITRIVLTS